MTFKNGLFALGEGGKELFFVDEKIIIKDFTYLRNRDGKTEGIYTGKEKIDPNLEKLYPVFARDYGGIATVTVSDQLSDDESLLSDSLGWYVSEWQFLSPVPQEMGRANPQQRTGGRIYLARDGSNIAEYLLSIRRLDQDAFNGIFETLKYVLPYAEDLQLVLTSEIERNVYLQLNEQDFKVPSWLFSFGTLRILALLAVLRHPQPPPLLIFAVFSNLA